MQLTALQAQNRSGLHFCTFIIVRPLSNTRSSEWLCNLLHCDFRIALDCIFALLSYSVHSHTPDLVNYYATYCIASSESLWTAFLHFYHLSDHSHTPDLVNYYATYCIASSESLWTAFLHFYHLQTTLTHQI